jgi:site-specific DNA recombinase
MPAIPAVAYYRMSSDRQEASVPEQRAAVQAYAAKHHFQIVREYEDLGISGDDTEARKGFQAMLRDAKEQGDFQAILCWDQDRFGRFDALEAGYWVKPLRDVGVWLETVAQGRINWDDFAGRMIYTLQQEGKHQFLMDLSRATTRGMLAKAKRGEWLGGRVPYGYDLVDERLVPNADAETVRWMFTTYMNSGLSLHDVAAELNTLGKPSPAGKLWYPNAIHKILTRPTYLGHTVWNRRREGKYHEVSQGELKPAPRRRQKVVRTKQDEWVRFEDTHTALVDQATFDRVQVVLAERRHLPGPRGDHGPYLFSGLLRCGHCGWPMHGGVNIQKHKDKKGRVRSEKLYTYKKYVCGNYNQRRRGGGCQCYTVWENRLFAVVSHKLAEYFLNPAVLEALKERIRLQLEAEERGRETPLQALKAKIEALTKKIDQGTERWLTAPAGLTGVLGEKLEAWRQERERLLRERKELEKPAASVGKLEESVDAIAAELHALQDAERLPTAMVRDKLRKIIERITLTFERVPHGPKRLKSVLVGGVIDIREELVTCSGVPIGSPLTTV